MTINESIQMEIDKIDEQIKEQKEKKERLIDRELSDVLNVMYIVGKHDQMYGSFLKDVYIEQNLPVIKSILKKGGIK